MLNPYMLFDQITHEKVRGARIELARLALNLYYDPTAYPFDISRLRVLSDVTKLKCLGAIAWAHSQGPDGADLIYKLGGQNILDGNARAWLEKILQGKRARRLGP